MRTLHVLLVCLPCLPVLLSACADDGLEPYVPPAPEPVAPPRPKPDWRDIVIKDAQVSDHNETKIGPVTVDMLRIWLGSKDFSPELFGRIFIRRHEWQKDLLGNLRVLLRDPDPVVRSGAARALRGLGPRALAARPDLLAVLSDRSPTVVAAALEALAEFGPLAAAAVPAIIAFLYSGERPVRIAAAEAIGHLGPAGRAAVPGLVAMLGEDDTGLFNAAARGLAGLGPFAAPAVGDLSRGLTRADRRGAAAAALGSIGPAARDSLSRLEVVMSLAKGRAPVLAAWATWRIEGTVEHALPCLLRVLGRKSAENPGLRSYWWFEWDGRRGHIHYRSGATSFPALVDRVETRTAALVAIGLMGRSAADAGPRLVGLLPSARGGEKSEIAWALRRIDGNYVRPFVRYLVNSGRRPDDVEASLLRATGRAGRRVLVEEMRGWGGPRGRAALRLLEDLIGETALLDELAYGSAGSKIHIIDAWRESRLDRVRFRREVHRRLHDPHVAVRRAAALAIAPHPLAINVLRRMLSAEEAEDRRRAAEALSDYGRRAWRAVPELTKALADPVDSVRWEAVDTLAGIGRDARPATRALWNCLSDENPWIATAAKKALQRIRQYRGEIP